MLVSKEGWFSILLFASKNFRFLLSGPNRQKAKLSGKRGALRIFLSKP